MKVIVCFKNPDAVSYAEDDMDVSEASEEQREQFEELCAKYFRYGEYCDIELDLEAGTARLREVS